jgi:hypothetical protein
MKTSLAKRYLIVLLITGGTACGSGSTQNSGIVVGTGPFLPLRVGNSWTYQITAIDGTVSAKIQSVVSEEMVGGAGDSQDTVAFKLVTGNQFADPNGDVSYQALVDTRYVRYRELSIEGKTGAIKKEQVFSDPWKLRVDVSAANTVAGTNWSVAYQEVDNDYPKVTAASADAGSSAADAGILTTSTEVMESWTVVGFDELVTVPAGKFKSLVVNRIAEGTNKTFWFVRGVGKVKETGIGDQTEELTTYKVTAAP